MLPLASLVRGWHCTGSEGPYDCLHFLFLMLLGGESGKAKAVVSIFSGMGLCTDRIGLVILGHSEMHKYWVEDRPLI